MRTPGRVLLGTACVWSLVLCGPATSAVLPSGFTESLVAGGLTNATAMEFAPDGRLFVCLQGGQLRVIKDGVLLPAPFVSLTVNANGERGLLGIAFDPAFASNQFVYLYYTATSPQVHNRVSRFTANGDVVVPGSEVPILDLEPLSGATNHNGGAIHFGIDGKLYVAVGENANAANSQTLANRLGKILRINSNGTIPSDNPFFGSATGVNRAIWAMGVRNPFTVAVQPGTGRIFINDVGQGAWEEINDGVAGANYGWPECEGPNVINSNTPCSAAYAAPFHAYDSLSPPACAVTGGTFYNPQIQQFPAEFAGTYFFADFCAGWIRRVNPANGVMTPFATGISNPVDLKVSSNGSLFYLARGGGGVVFRIDGFPPPAAHPGATADFDGNGIDDIAVYRPATGTWRVRNEFEIQFGDVGDIPVPGDYNGDGTTDLAVYRPSTGAWYVRNLLAVQFGDEGDIPIPADYNGDGSTDIAVYRPTTGVWYVRNQFAVQFGERGDRPVPADYNGDGASDVAVYRVTTGTWYVRNQFVMILGGQPVPGDYDGDGTDEPAGYYPTHGQWYFADHSWVQFGQRGDVPVPRDYNGDGVTDLAVYRPSTRTWIVRGLSTTQFGEAAELVVPRAPIPRASPGDYDGDTATDVGVYRPSTSSWFVRNRLAVQFGMAGDRPVPADYNGDGIVDVATYRPSLGRWLVRNQFQIDFGGPDDIPVPGDYTGDGLTDLAFFRPSTGTWHVRGFLVVPFGQDGDIPVPGDYNGDGITDMAVYRPSTGMWMVRKVMAVQFGDSTDLPVPADYNQDGVVDIAVYRPSTGVWYARNLFATQFGEPGDMPVAGEYVHGRLTELAVYRPSTGQWFVRNRFVVQFGDVGDVPVVRIGGNP